MALTYIEAIGIGFPGVQCHAVGDGSVYESIVWDSGSPLPAKQELDNWIAANTAAVGITLTKYQFRKLFTLPERITLDNVASNTAIAANYKAMLVTIMKDLELSAEVQLSNPDVVNGVQFLELLGLIGSGRAAQILSNTPPSAV